MQRFLSLLLLAFVLLANTLAAQAPLHRAVSPAGATMSSQDGSVSYSVGQVFFQRTTGPAGQVAEGIHQALPNGPTVSDPPSCTNFDRLQVYPNPTADVVRITSGILQCPDVAYHLYTPTGRLLARGILGSNTEIIDLRQQPAGAYLLTITSAGEITHRRTLIKTIARGH